MSVNFSDDGWEQYTHWVAADRKIAKRINALIKDIKRRGHLPV
jgi:toxin YoeB